MDLISNEDKDILKSHQNIYLMSVFYWDEISRNKVLMEGLDFDNNSLCKRLKEQNPSMTDDEIKAYVFSMWITMINNI